MDATPETLLHADRVHEFYTKVRPDLVPKLKLIVILRDPIEREMSLYNHKKQEYVKANGEELLGEWASSVAFPNNGTVMTFDQYATKMVSKYVSERYLDATVKYVDHLRTWISFFTREQLLVLNYDEVHLNPDVIQLRIRAFLEEPLIGGLVSENNTIVSSATRRELEPIFQEKNEELYDFLDNVPGRPWMEQYPFPHFSASGDKKAVVQRRVKDNKSNQTEEPALPNVLLIGAQKAGATRVSC